MQALVFIVVLCIAVCDGGQTCLSCSEVVDSIECANYTDCTDDEVCYTHGYVTESGKQHFDFGCSLQHVCPTPDFVFIGKRGAGRHTTCFECCNDTQLCNQDLDCNTTSPIAPVLANPPRGCSDIDPKIRVSGVYTIYPLGILHKPLKVHCIVDDSTRIWTVIQQRNNGLVDFHRDWNSYKHGFGVPYGSYWMGNDAIHALTSSENYELMINMSDFNAVVKYAEYQTFHVGDESSGYKLNVSGYSGTAGDDLAYHSGNMFSTYDRDNDRSSTANCASNLNGAWWFNSCHFSDLNGEYMYGTQGVSGRGVVWYSFKGAFRSLSSTLMMVRKK